MRPIGGEMFRKAWHVKSARRSAWLILVVVAVVVLAASADARSAAQRSPKAGAQVARSAPVRPGSQRATTAPSRLRLRKTPAARAIATYHRTLVTAQIPTQTDQCDWGNRFTGKAVVEDPLIQFPGLYLPGDPERCGVEKVENDAYDIYAEMHDLSPGDPDIELAGQYEIAGTIWELLQQIVLAHESNPSGLSSDQTEAYDWLQHVVDAPLVAAAQDAQNEYKKWAAAPCSYSPPNPKLFDFTPLVDPACGTTVASLLAGPTPPSYENFLEYGTYDEDQTTNVGLASSQAEAIEAEQIGEGAGLVGSMLLGAGAHGINSLTSSALLKSYRAAIFPESQAGKGQAISERRANIRRARFKQQQSDEDVEDVERDAKLIEDGAKEDSVISNTVDDAVDDSVKAGMDVERATTELGPEVLDGPAVIVGLAIDALVSEATKVAAEVQIPVQLQDNLNTVKAQALQDLLDGAASDGGYQTALAYFEGQLDIPKPTVGATTASTVNSPPNDGSEWEVTPVSGDEVTGTPLTTTFAPTVKLVTWPLGVDQGVNGLNTSQFALYHGQAWYSVDSNSLLDDDAAAGLKGWLPSGEVRYFDWEGDPRIAIVDGNHFLDMPSPGTDDLGGQDMGDMCAEGDSECDETNVLFAVESAAGINSSTTTYAYDASGNLGVEQSSEPSNGTLKAPYKMVRLTIKPDPGAQAVQNINNQWGHTASVEDNATFGEGGLFAGDTVTLTDPEANPLGYAETYTWTVESRCAHAATCTPSSDSAFHSEPTVTLTGQSVTYTWPAPGVYHVRLTTTDQYGTTQVSDQDVTVDGVDPTLTLGSSTGFAGDGVLGPVKNGSSQTVTGCITDPDDAYADPQVTVDWGDGTTDTASANGDASSTVSFHYGTTDSCPSLWQFSATHTYNLTPPGGPEGQKAIKITVGDGSGDSVTSNAYVDIDFTSVPQFTSGDATTFAAGAGGTFVVSAGGTPTPTLALSGGSLPPGMGFQPQGDGTALITGDPAAGAAGTWPLTIAATNSQGTTSQSFTLTVTAPPTITSASSAAVALNESATVSLTASGSPSPGLLVSGALPTGMVAQDSAGGGTGSITGTPRELGVYPLSVQASNSAGTATQSFALTVGSTPSFTSPSSTGFVEGADPSTFAITTSGFPAASVSCASPCTLPSGLGFAANADGTAEIYGSASTAATDQITLTASNSVGSSQQTLTVTSSATGGPPITVSSGASYDSSSGSWTAPMTVGSAADIEISAPSSSLSELGQLPAGLSFTDNGDGTATISGTPAAGTGGWYGLVIQSQLQGGQGGATPGIAFIELEVEGAPTMTSAPQAVFTSGQAGSFTVSTSGLPYAVVSASSLPDGLTLAAGDDGTATISGTPASDAVGTHSVTLQMENLITYPQAASAELTIVVQQAPAITSADSAAFAEGRSGSFTLTTTGSPAPALRIVSGTLPPGVSFQDNGDGTGTFSGVATDTVEKSYDVTVLATSAAGQTAQPLTLSTGAAPTIAPQSTAAFTAGSSGSVTVASPTQPTPRFSATGLPAGLSLTDTGTGSATIQGTPAAGSGGLYSVTVTASNAYGATSRVIALTVAEAPHFAGTGFGFSCAGADPTVTAASFLSTGTWTLCFSGYPAPQLGIGGTLPAGISMTDNGDGSALISGTAATGAGGPDPLTVIATNAAGTTKVPITLTIDQPVAQPAYLTATFVPGQSNTSQISAPGYPLPAISLSDRGCGSAPDWLTLHDNGNGTATLSGDPPVSAAGQQFFFQVREDQGVGNGAFPCVVLTVAPVALVHDTPPAPLVGGDYDYSFSSTDPSATYSVESTSSSSPPEATPAVRLRSGARIELRASKHARVLPPGLTLSRAGVLHGRPSTVGTWRFRVVVTTSRGRSVSNPITVKVRSAPHELEIRAFRTYGPDGGGDWFVTARNMSGVSVALFGWRVAMFAPRSRTAIDVRLPVMSLRPGADVTVAGPSFSLARRTRTVLGLPVSRLVSGFELIAPDGRVVDRAGETGAPAVTIAGRGLVAPTRRRLGSQSAFIRRAVAGHLLDTNDNARDFVYRRVPTPRIRFTSTPPRHPAVGGRYRVAADGGGTRVRFTLGSGSSKGACRLSGHVVRFTGRGTCVLVATQVGSLMFSPGLSVSQRIAVGPRSRRPQWAASARLGSFQFGRG